MFSFEAFWQILTTKLPVFMEGVGVTVQLALYTALFGSLVGVVVALMRLSRIRPLRWLSGATTHTSPNAFAVSASWRMPPASMPSSFVIKINLPMFAPPSCKNFSLEVYHIYFDKSRRRFKILLCHICL